MTEKQLTLNLPQLFSILSMLFIGFLAASALQAWTGPTGTAPAGNVSAPINVGTTDQVKNAGLSVNALTVFGSSYIQTKLGINNPNPVVALDIAGIEKIGNGGEPCQAITEGAIRYNSTSKKMEYCDGSAWTQLGGGGGTLQTQTITTSGSFTVPNSFIVLIALVSGGGGGGGGGSAGTATGGTGGTGGTSQFGSIVGAGGTGGTGCAQRGLVRGQVGSDGTGSGGDTNRTGGGGTSGTGANCNNGVFGGRGGTGGFAEKIYAPSTLTPGSTISITVGAGGAGGVGNTGGDGSAGGGGSVIISWQ